MWGAGGTALMSRKSSSSGARRLATRCWMVCLRRGSPGPGDGAGDAQGAVRRDTGIAREM